MMVVAYLKKDYNRIRYINHFTDLVMEEKNVCLHLNEEENSQLQFIMHEIHGSLRSIDLALRAITDKNLSTSEGRALIKEMAEQAQEATFDITNQLDYWQISNDERYFLDVPMRYQNIWRHFAKPNPYFAKRIKAGGIDYSVQKVGTSIIKDYYGYGIVNALANIMLDNALKYTPAGGSIECTFEYDEDNSLIITMENPGPYVSKEEMSGIFSCGVRGKNAIQGSYRGSGYGLNFLKLIVDAHEGDVDIESTYTHQSDGVKFGQFKISVTLPEFQEYDDTMDDD